MFDDCSSSVELNSSVLPNETICKYQLRRDEVRTDGTVRHNAFMPASDGTRSVFRISSLSDSDVWKLGWEKVANLRGLPLLGRFEISAELVFDQGLKFNPDADRNSRHAEIVGWPDEKAKRQSIAQILAAEAKALRYQQAG